MKLVTPDTFWNFVDKVDKGESDCWNWLGYVAPDGYGTVYINGERLLAHRYAYEQSVGLIPKGKDLHHECHNRKCVNPNHLKPLTRKEHLAFSESWGVVEYQLNKTHCPKGHPYDSSNTYYLPNGKGRDCRICRKDAKRRWLEKVQC